MLRIPLTPVLVLALLALGAGPAIAAAKPAKKAVAKSSKRVAAKAPGKVKAPIQSKSQAQTRVQSQSQTAVADDEPALVPEQLAIADRVMVGTVACEFGQSIQIAAVAAKPGHFVLTAGPAQYALVPYETSTGAVRLEDRKQGVVWLQIPSKSMLLSAKLGQRLVDNCLHEAQRFAVVASADGLGIAQPLPPEEPAAGDDWTLAALWPATPSDAMLPGWLDVWAPPVQVLAWVPLDNPAPAPAPAISAELAVPELSAVHATP